MKVLYPNIGRRIKAVLVDSMLFVIVTMTILPFIAKFNFKHTWIKITILLFPYFILDPLLVSFTGGSIGHHAFKIRVRHTIKNQNIGLIFASVRFLMKTILGWFSLIMILFTKKRQAFHDLIVNSIIIMNYPEGIEVEDGLKERSFEEEGYIYPSKFWRFFVIGIYNFLLYWLFNILLTFFLPEQCVENMERGGRICNQLDETLIVIMTFSWIAGVISIIYFGIGAQLFGCRRKPIQSP